MPDETWEEAAASVPAPEPIPDMSETEDDGSGRLVGEGAGQETNIAQVFVDERLSGRYLWSAAFKWMRYDEGRWVSCTDEAVIEVARKFVTAKVRQAVNRMARGADASAALDMWRRYLTASRLSAIVGLARGITEVQSDSFDLHHDLLNTPSGVVHLPTAELRPHDPKLLLTKTTGVPFVPGADHPDLKSALECVPAEIVDWLQARLGQALTGHMPPTDDILFWEGGGENGKSTIVNAVRKAVGDYFKMLPHKVLLPARDGTYGPEVMLLRGARIVAMEETPEGGKLSERQVKQIAGTPRLVARDLYSKPVEWDATHATIVTSNELPTVTSTDHGTWRRLTVVPFPYTYRKENEGQLGPNDRLSDPTLRDRVLENSEVHVAALAWLVDGAHRWYSAGRPALRHPELVVAATAAWRRTTDSLLAFFNEFMAFDESSHVSTTDFVVAFDFWLTMNQQQSWGGNLIGRRLTSHELFKSNGITKTNTVTGTTISRPTHLGPAMPTPPQGRYNAFRGLKFVNPNHD